VREAPPHLAYAEELELFERTMEHWFTHAKQSRADTIQQRQELSDIQLNVSVLNDLQLRIVNSYLRATELENAMESMEHMFWRLCIQSEGRSGSSQPSHALARQAFYTERRPNEGTADCEHHRRAPTHIETPSTRNSMLMRGHEGVNADANMREVNPWASTCTNEGQALLHAHNRAVPAVGTAPALAKGTSSIEPASGAEKATAAKLEVMEPMATGHMNEAPPPGGKRMDKPEAPPLKGERVVETTPPRKGGRLHEVLPLEGERECSTMPQKSPCEGMSITLKGTTPGDLEMPWDPGGEENVEHEVNAPPQERDTVSCRGACMASCAMSCRGAYGSAMKFCGTRVKSKPEESVKPHYHRKAVTHLCIRPILPFRCREADLFSSLRPIERVRTPFCDSKCESQSRSRTTRNKRPFGGRHTRVMLSHAHCAAWPQCRHLLRTPTPRAFARGIPFRQLCRRLVVTVDSPHLATSIRRYAGHFVDGPFIHIPAPVCGAVFTHAHRGIVFDRQ